MPPLGIEVGVVIRKRKERVMSKKIYSVVDPGFSKGGGGGA